MSFLLRNARLADDAPLQDIYVKQQTIGEIGVGLRYAATNEWDLAGRVVLPGLVDVHTHLDKSYSSIDNQSGTLLEAIDVWGRIKKERTRSELKTAIRRALQNASLNGVTSMRSHIDVGDAADLSTVETVLALRTEMQPQIDIQLVILGALGRDAVANQAARDASGLGMDIIGGAPSLLDDPLHSLSAIFALAEQTGKPIDLHIDETEDPKMLILEDLAERTIAHGMQGQVTAGHCCSLAFVEQRTADRVMDKVAAAEINVVTLPSCNLVLMGRQMHPAPRGTTRVKELLARGIRVSAASDNVHDPFNPFGAYDLLQIANLNAHVAHLTGADELQTSLDMVTMYPAQVFGATAAIEVGADADLVVIDTQCRLDTITSPPQRLATFKRGQLVVKSEIQRVWGNL